MRRSATLVALSGDDAGDFRISNVGVLTFRAYRRTTKTRWDADMDNMYMVTVKADDGTYMDTHDVTVTVTDVDEDGAPGGSLLDRYDDNDNDRIDRSEVLDGINDYLFGTEGQAISKAEVLDLIRMYLFP